MLMLHLACYWLQLLLLRPFFLPREKLINPNTSTTPFTPPAIAYRNSVRFSLRETALIECPKAAGRIVVLFQAYRTIFGLRLITITAVQIAYIAGKMHIVLASAASSDLSWQRSSDDAIACIHALREVGETWTSGKASADVLADLLSQEQALRPHFTKLSMKFLPTPRKMDPPPYSSPANYSTRYARYLPVFSVEPC